LLVARTEHGKSDLSHGDLGTMRQPFRLAIVATVVTGFAFQASAALAADEIFPDENLRNVISKIMHKKTGKEEIDESKLKDIYFLKAPGKKIANLTGLEKCRNLAQINLADNAIEDVSPLAGLMNVQSLDLSKNKIGDLTPLGKLAKLQYLQLEGNQIEKLDALKELKKLSALYLSKNKVQSVAPLSGLEKLTSLYLDDNQLTDVKGLEKLKWLSSLDLRNNKIEDVTPLASMTELRYTMLQKNKVTDIAPLVAMAKKDAEGDRRFAPYWHLYLKDNPLNDEATKSHIPELKNHGVRVKME